MANNITWADRTDNPSVTKTGATYEADKTIYNTVKAWLNEPSQSLGTFNPTMTFDGSGAYNDYTLSTNDTINCSGIKNGNWRYVRIIGNGVNTLSLGTNTVAWGGTFGTLPSGNNELVMMSMADRVFCVIKNPQTEQLNAPTNFMATAGNAQNTLTWDSVASADGYTLRFHDGDGLWAAVPSYDGTSTNYLHDSLTNGTTYYYSLFATDSSGTFSQSASVQTNAMPTAATWVPSDLGTNLQVWLEAATIGSDGSSVDGSNNLGTWKNKGVRGDFTQTTTASKPIWDGSSKVTFDGSNDIMTILGSKSEAWLKNIHDGTGTYDIAIKFATVAANPDNILHLLGTSGVSSFLGFEIAYEDRSAFSNNDAVRAFVMDGAGGIPVNNKTSNAFFPAQTVGWARFTFDADNGTAANRSTIYNSSTNESNNASSVSPVTGNAAYDLGIGGIVTSATPSFSYSNIEVYEVIITDRALTSQEWTDILAR